MSYEKTFTIIKLIDLDGVNKWSSSIINEYINRNPSINTGSKAVIGIIDDYAKLYKQVERLKLEKYEIEKKLNAEIEGLRLLYKNAQIVRNNFIQFFDSLNYEK